MYGEYFDVPSPDELVFISSFSGGEVFRSGMTFRRGYGKFRRHPHHLPPGGDQVAFEPAAQVPAVLDRPHRVGRQAGRPLTCPPQAHGR